MNEHLLSDSEVARFLVSGYHLVEPEFPAGLNESIADKLDALDCNPGDAITETVPGLLQVLDHPAVKGALASLLGPDYEVQPHRHWHCRQPGSGHMNWHQDGLNNRDVLLNRFLGLYYPTEVTADMGPTIIVPGTQFRNAPTDRMATYTNIRGQVPLVVKGRHRGLHPLRPLARHGRQPLAAQAAHDQVPLPPHPGQHRAHLESRPEGGRQACRLERARPVRGRRQHPRLRQPAGSLPERPLQGARHPPPELETTSWACRRERLYATRFLRERLSVVPGSSSGSRQRRFR